MICKISYNIFRKIVHFKIIEMNDINYININYLRYTLSIMKLIWFSMNAKIIKNRKSTENHQISMIKFKMMKLMIEMFDI